MLASLLLAGLLQGAFDPRHPLLLTGAAVLAADGESWRDASVRLEDGRITAITSGGASASEEGTEGLDLRGLFLVPGLIDLHSHLLLHPYDEVPWEDQVLRESLELRVVRAVPAMRATLEAGFTTLRDLGTEGAGFADVALRDAVARGIVPGPRIFASTRALVASGSYGPMGFDPRWDVPRGAQVADGVDGVRRAVREQIAAGADWIKVYADYRRRPEAPRTPTFSLEELRSAVEEASSAGLSVAAHATTDEGIRRAVLAGVRTIEHGDGATRETLALLREHGVVLCPTLAASEAIARYSGWSPGQPEPARLAGARALLRAAREAGVTIACGSDVGVFAHGQNARELELLTDCGLSPTEALRAATITAAAVLGREQELGRIAVGFGADLVVLREDPLRTPSALRTVVLVVREGRIVVDRRSSAR